MCLDRRRSVVQSKSASRTGKRSTQADLVTLCCPSLQTKRAGAWTVVCPSAIPAVRWVISSLTGTTSSGETNGARLSAVCRPPTTFQSSPVDCAPLHARRRVSKGLTAPRSRLGTLRLPLLIRPGKTAASFRWCLSGIHSRRLQWSDLAPQDWQPPSSSPVRGIRSSSTSVTTPSAGCCVMASRILRWKNRFSTAGLSRWCWRVPSSRRILRSASISLASSYASGLTPSSWLPVPPFHACWMLQVLSSTGSVMPWSTSLSKTASWRGQRCLIRSTLTVSMLSSSVAEILPPTV